MSHSAAEALRRLPSDVSAAGQSLASGNRSTPFLGIESENRTVNPPWCRKPFPAIAKFLCGLLSIVAIGGIGFAIAAVVMEPKLISDKPCVYVRSGTARRVMNCPEKLVIPKECTVALGGQKVGTFLWACDLGRTAHRLTDLRPGNMYELGVHAPSIKTMWFNPEAIEADPLPRSETHEVFFHAPSRSAYLSNFGLGLLLNVSFDETGELVPAARTWLLNADSSAVHHVGAGADGAIWISTQGDDHIHLVDPLDGLKARHSFAVPKTCKLCDGTKSVSDPHSVVPDVSRTDGTVWVTLKGDPPPAMEFGSPELYYAKVVEGLEPELNFSKDQGWAVWRIAPGDYDESKDANGGTLFKAQPTPGMSAIDNFGNSYHAQDKAPYVLRIAAGADGFNLSTGDRVQIPLPNNKALAAQRQDSGYLFNAGGPSVVRDPAGGIWLCTLTMQRGWMLRFAPGATCAYDAPTKAYRDCYTVPIKLDEIFNATDQERVRKYVAAGPGGDASFKVDREIIHMAFSTMGGPSGDKNMMYLLSSSIANEHTYEAVIALEMTADFTALRTNGIRREVFLPAEHGAVHRMSVAELSGSHSATFKRSLLVSGLKANCLYQIPLAELEV